MKPALYLIATLALITPALAEVDKDALPKVEDGFEINFFVKEPHIINPSSLCFDKRGRLFVGAGPQYRHPKEDSPTDYIKILIDEDGDGVAETVKTFAEGFNCIESMAWKGEELWVANSPELTVLRDTDGDDVADEYQVIYTGLNNLRHSLHGLNWGPDGWLYVTIGNTWVKPNAPKPFRDLQGLKSDDATEYPLTKVYTRETYPKSYHPMNKDEKEGGVFRCRPGGHDLELFARGMRNPFDMCMDGGFNWLATDNDPGPPADRIFMPIRHGHYGMRHPWKFDWKGVHPAVAPSSDLFPGVSGSGTGVVFYNAGHFPEQYRNRHLIADWTNNCIYLYTPKWDGALQVPAEAKRKIVESSGGYGDLQWKGEEGRSLFRPTDMEIGPDGAVYIAGWGSVYGTEYVPKEKWTAEESAKYQGRVFRLRHKDPPISREQWDGPKRKKDIKTWSPAELLEDLGQAVHVWRVNAQDELVRRGASVRGDLLKAVISGDLSETQSTWAIWAVGRIDKASGGDHADCGKIAREGSDLNLRIQATRILGENKVSTAAPLLIELLADPEPRIRHAAMQSLDLVGWGEHAGVIVDAIAEESDRVTAYADWQVMRRQLSSEERRKLLEDKRFLVRQMAALGLMEDGDRDLQGRANDYLQDSGAGSGKAKREEAPAPTSTVVIRAAERNFRGKTSVSFKTMTSGKVGPPAGGKPVGKAVQIDVRYTLDGSEPKANSAKAAKDVAVTKDTTVKAGAFVGKQLVSEIASLSLHQITDSEWKDRLFVHGLSREGCEVVDDGLQRGVQAYADDRRETISEVPDAIAGSTQLRTGKSDRKSNAADFLSFEINLPATVMVAYDATAKIPGWLADGWKKTGHTVGTSQGARFLVYQKEVEAGPVVLGGNGGAPAMYQGYLRKAGAVMTGGAAVKPLLAKADLKRGEEIFFGRGTCFACHQVKGRGFVVGPDLVAINKRHDADYVIQSILEPDVYIVEGFQQTSLELKDGRKLFGMIQEETAQQLKIVLPTGEVIEASVDDVQKRDDAEHSGMPASFAYTLSAQDVADMTAWIMGLK
jgi:putative membrane-bound dehydrogenase-like protein